MTDKKKTTKREFDKAYSKHLPNNWIRFAFKYFSKTTEKENMSLSNTLTFVLMGLFLAGFFGTVFNAPVLLIKWATIIYSSILALLVFYLFTAVFLNNRRIKKIAKELDIDIVEYNKLVRKFYP
jgi:ABC-type branched-subunit amino acid transport system permease subunit